VEPIAWTNLGDAPVRELSPGVRIRPLWRGAHDRAALVLELDPGAVWDGVDLHEPGPEELYVLDGIFNDGIRDYPAGTFVHNPAGSSHVPQSPTGCRLFVFYPEG
jgi:anti-sigma factor ChrR (cupin superfamily)